ncbi:MAG: prolipoprotein diacylglyceryl transferase [Myxococcales bacterium]|nr:MAG: prolipoprotein diacylglyceryl transferase [Myxococcales bacterium]
MDHWVWDIDPVMLRLGPLQIRYYGLLFALLLLTGFHFFKVVLRRIGYPENMLYGYFYWVSICGILGARIGHCLLYEPSKYLSDPIEILYIWHGGLASHGGTAGIILGLTLYAYRNRIPWFIVADASAYSAAIAATLVRVGNFLNSEIVGRPSDLPWAMYFPRSGYPNVPRHPSQIYEALIGASIFGLIYWLDHKFGNRKPRGILVGTFLVLYFFLRFMVEFVKEYQMLTPEESPLTEGQYYSIPFFIFGCVMLWHAWKDRGRASGKIPPESYSPPAQPVRSKTRRK